MAPAEGYQQHEPETWIVYIKRYLGVAKEILSMEDRITAYPKAMDNLRKATALAIACMEQYGCPERKLNVQP